MMSAIEDPRVGTKFASLDEVEKYMLSWMKAKSVLFTRGRSSKLKGHEKNFELIQFRSIEYTCKHGGTPYRANTTGQRTSSTCKVNYPAVLQFQCLQNQGYLEITKVHLSHENHVPSEGLYRHYAEVRRPEPEDQAQTLKFLEMKCDKKHLQEELRTKLGKHVTLKDLSNLRAKLKIGDDKDLTEAVKFLMEEKDADVSILKRGTKFEALYFSTPDMRHSLAAWPEIVAVDGTYSLLDSNLTLMIMLVEDSNGASEVVAAGLLAVEDAPTVSWFLSTFKENNRDVCSKIKCFMSDKDHVGRTALKTLFYDSEKKESPPIYICLFHTLKAFRLAMGAQGMSLSKQEREEKSMRNLKQ